MTTEVLNESFDALPGVEWTISLARPVALNNTPTVAFHDRLGYSCGADAYVKLTDRRILHVRSRSGLPLVGSIAVHYRPAVASALPLRRQPAIQVGDLAS